MESISHVAILGSDGIIYALPAPNRHHNLFAVYEEYAEVTCPGEQGFLTDTGRFVDRKEALAIAQVANQIIEKYGNPNMLFSEDVW